MQQNNFEAQHQEQIDDLPKQRVMFITRAVATIDEVVENSGIPERYVLPKDKQHSYTEVPRLGESTPTQIKPTPTESTTTAEFLTSADVASLTEYASKLAPSSEEHHRVKENS